MKARSLVAALFVAMALAPAPVLAAEATCANGFLRCINDAHDSAWWLQAAQEIECGVGYYGCLRRISTGC